MEPPDFWVSVTLRCERERASKGDSQGRSSFEGRLRRPPQDDGERPEIQLITVLVHPAFGLVQRPRSAPLAKLFLLVRRPGNSPPPSTPAARNQQQPLDAEFLLHHLFQPHPERVELPFARPARDG